jgi:hypothetical protein
MEILSRCLSRSLAMLDSEHLIELARRQRLLVQMVHSLAAEPPIFEATRISEATFAGTRQANDRHSMAARWLLSRPAWLKALSSLPVGVAFEWKSYSSAFQVPHPRPEIRRIC